MTRAELTAALLAAERDLADAQWEVDRAPDYAATLTVADMRRIEDRHDAALTRRNNLRFELRKLR